MDPEAYVAADRRTWIRCAEPPEELAGLLLLVDDDAVRGAPPDLQRHAGGRDPARVRDGAALGEGEGPLLRRPTELRAREHLQPPTERLAEVVQAVRVATQLPERSVLLCEVGDGVERCDAGEQPRMPREQQERLL